MREIRINAAFAGQEFESIDEHFRWSNYSRQRVHVLLSIDVPKSDMNQGQGCDICTRADNDYAISWTHSYGKGRVFYTSLGHAPAVFMDKTIVQHIMAGVQFALGDLDSDTTPAAPAGRLPRNLKLLQPAEVRTAMRTYRTGLGVRCEFCHVDGNDASDEKPQKLTARKMIAMTREINAHFPDTGKVHVSCYTCHRGAEQPLAAPPPQ